MTICGKFIALGFSIFCLTSCSVKEDRSLCPCWLTVLTDTLAVSDVRLRTVWENRLVFDMNVRRVNQLESLEVKVPRGEVILFSSFGQKHLIEKDYKLDLPIGSQMDSLYAMSSVLKTEAESVMTRLVYHKNFSTVRLEFDASDEHYRNYDVVVRGNVSGLNALTLQPLLGNYMFHPYFVPAKGYLFRVPRQVDDSLVAELYLGSRFVDVIPLGRLINQSGFDWSTQDLGDIHVVADMPEQQFTISVVKWKGTVPVQVVI